MRAPRTPKAEPLDLCRSEVAHVADALDELMSIHGSRTEASRATGLSKHLFDKLLQRKGAEKVTRAALEKVALLFHMTTEHLLAGLVSARMGRGRWKPRPAFWGDGLNAHDLSPEELRWWARQSSIRASSADLARIMEARDLLAGKGSRVPLVPA